VQRIYCDDAMMSRYRASAKRFASSGRPEILVSNRPLPLRLSLLDGMAEHYRMMRLIAHFPMVGPDGTRQRVNPPRLPFRIGRMLERYLRIR